MENRRALPVPEDVRAALVESGVMPNFQKRPFQQRNDYLAWISRARRDETRRHRVTQMIEELRRGGV